MVSALASNTLIAMGFDEQTVLDLPATTNVPYSEEELSRRDKEDDYSENYRDALVTLYSEVALNYVDLRTFQARLRFAESNIEAQRGSVKLTSDRLDAGLASDVDVSQAESNLAISEALIPQLRGLLVLVIDFGDNFPAAIKL